MGEDEFHHIIIDCSAGKAQEVLKQAQQVGMMHSSYSYLLTTLVRSLCIEFSILCIDKAFFMNIVYISS